MPTDELRPTPTIRVIFIGFVVTNIRDGADSATLGALRDSPCHQPRVRITKITPEAGPNPFLPDPEIQPGEDFSISVENNPGQGIRVFQTNTDAFNRLDDENDRRDFRSFVDLEELFGKSLTVDDSTLNPRFTMNDGVFYTKTVSPGEMRIKRRKNAPSSRFGRFALHLGANIYLDGPGSKATFTNGTDAVFTVEKAQDPAQQIRYVIEFDCDCLMDADESDFPLIYDVVGAGLSDEEKELSLEGDPQRTGPNLTPEVYCIAGNVKRP
ncbi:MAG: hypothetical protein AABN34_07965 [Acidobacteriota bacterium]